MTYKESITVFPLKANKKKNAVQLLLSLPLAHPCVTTALGNQTSKGSLDICRSKMSRMKMGKSTSKYSDDTVITVNPTEEVNVNNIQHTVRKRGRPKKSNK